MEQRPTYRANVALDITLAALTMTDTPMGLKDIIGLAADMMSLFGLTGLFTWSFVRKNMEGQQPADIGISVFALAVKFFMSIGVLVCLLIPAFFFHVFVIMVLSDSYTPSEALWSDRKSTAYTVSYVLNCMWLIPMAVLSVSSVFTWSVKPFRRFHRVFTGK